jgi:Tol biopolymer transport system component
MNVLAALVLAYGCGSCLPGHHGGIATIRVDGTHRQTLLAEGPNQFLWQPTWAPDGRRFAYIAEPKRGERRLMIARADGGERRTLVRNAFYPTWSPDGKRIAFVRNYEVWVVRADGRGVHRVIGRRRHGAADGPLAWSPDSRRLAFVADDVLYVIRENGTGLLRVSKFPAADPAWSADGRSVYYLSGRHNAYIASVPRRHDLTTGDDRSFLARPHPDYVEGAWSPDRRFFAYALIVPKGGETYHDLWVLRLSDGRRFHVTQVPGGSFGLSWKP